MKFLYYLIQWTWGIIQNIIGGLFCLIMMLHGNKPEMQRNAVCIETKYNWGGACNIGMFIFLGKGCRSCIPHEYGHSIQGLMWGPLWLFVVAIPSLTRAGYRTWYYDHVYPKTRKSLPHYDAVWFEGQATALGKRAFANEWKWL